MSFLQTLYFDLHWGAKLFLGGEGLKTYFIFGQPYAKLDIDKQKGGGNV